MTGSESKTDRPAVSRSADPVEYHLRYWQQRLSDLGKTGELGPEPGTEPAVEHLGEFPDSSLDLRQLGIRLTQLRIELEAVNRDTHRHSLQLGQNLLDETGNSRDPGDGTDRPLVTLGLPGIGFSPFEVASLDGFETKSLPKQGFSGLASPEDRSLLRRPCPLCWFPDGIPAGQSLLVASSRLGQRLDQYDNWFTALRTIALRFQPDQVFLITQAGMTADPFVRRLAVLFGFSILDFIPWPQESKGKTETSTSVSKVPGPAPPGTEKAAGRLDAGLNSGTGYFRCYYWLPDLPDFHPAVSAKSAAGRSSRMNGLRSLIEPENVPPSDLRQLTAGRAGDTRDAGSPDHCLITWTRHLFLLSLRRGGNVWQGVCSRLRQAEYLEQENLKQGNAEPENLNSEKLNWEMSFPKTRLLICPQLTKPKIQQEVLQRGGVGWYLWDAEDQVGPFSDQSVARKGFPEPVNARVTRGVDQRSSRHLPMFEKEKCETSILALDEFPEESFLIHWTRPSVEPWPGQSEQAFIDSLLFQDDSRLRGELQVLTRILMTGRLIGSRRWNRSGQAVVSLADRRLSELAQLRTFRQHLGRWDALPYGIAIDREVLRQRGARPVIYGDPADWKKLAPQQQPFFQPATSKEGRIDWRIEREWRWLGDLNLRALPVQAIAVFVPQRSEARQLASCSPWPIVCLD
jgi:hypothetical protein